MKTLRFILIVVLLISVSATAQTRLNLKIDSLVISNDTVLPKLQNQLKLKNPFGSENHRFVLPGNKQFQLNPNLAVIPNQKSRVYADPNFKMPILKPFYYSDMPVVKPDSSIHYHLRIKRLGK
ncbi:MAG: hypothetical protein Q8S54_11865 [Bacteroidota bacterium]|nr:hypothetical protein [Odoribacter sp.]MDP3643872.1 hypothetical protein [Bacteroidota bacterium]